MIAPVKGPNRRTVISLLPGITAGAWPRRNLVVFIHRPAKYQPTPENRGVAEIMIAKQRNGPTGTVRLRWCEESTPFDDLETVSG